MSVSFNLKQALIRAGATEIVEESDKHQFSVEKNGKTWRLAIKWPDPSSLPKYYVSLEHCTQHRPHISWDGFICYSDGEGIFFLEEHLEQVLVETLDKAVAILESGEDGDLTEFWDELEGYFNTIGSTKICGRSHCYFNLDDAPRSLNSQIPSGSSKTIKFFDEESACWDLGDTSKALLGSNNNPKKGKKVRKTKAKKPKCLTPTGYYLPLSAPAIPPLPGEQWTIDAVLGLVEPFTVLLPELKEYLKKRHQRYVFSFPRPGKERGAFAVEIYLRRDNGQKIIYLEVERRSPQYLKKRCCVPNGMRKSEPKIAVIGCGSVGGNIAMLLAQSGIHNLTLVDHDIYEVNNLYRHVLPKRYVGKYKVEALKHYLENSFPCMHINGIPKNASEWLVRDNFVEHDIIIAATGNPTLERRMGKIFNEISHVGHAFLSAWLEPLGLGGHSVIQVAGSKGCLNCLYTNGNTPAVHPVVSFIQSDQKVSRNLTGCGGAFTPFSSLDAQQTSLLAMRALDDYLSGSTQSDYRFWIGNNKAAEENDIAVSDVFNCQFENKQDWWEQQLERGCPVCNSLGR